MSNITGGQNLEYAYLLASTLKWRTWPEEKPEEGACVIVKRDKEVASLGSFTSLSDSHGNEFWSVGHTVLYPSPGDRWMYVSDLEVVR